MKQDGRLAEWRGKKVLVVGVGLHGGAAALMRWLLQQSSIVRATDTKSALALAPTVKQFRPRKITWKLGGHRQADFAWADCIIQNPGVPDTMPLIQWAKQQKKEMHTEATIFFRYCPCPIIGITGTRGKTTTATLTADLLRRPGQRVVLSGNVAKTAMLDYLDGLKSGDLAVLELSSFQLESLPAVRRSPHIAVMTNLKVDHLNRYGSMTAYAKAKYNIFRWQTPGDWAVLNADSPYARAVKKITPAQLMWFSPRRRFGARGVTIEKQWIIAYHHSAVTRLAPLRSWKLLGQHQLENMLAAVAVAYISGRPPSTIKKVLASFNGVPHRQSVVGQWRGKTFVNDTTATTPDGVLAALDVYPSAIFILGGTDKKLQFGPLVKRFVNRRVPVVLLPGTATEKIVREFQRACFKRFSLAADMPQAVQQAVAAAKPGQPVILSPGAASFGLFVHEFDRGDQFVRAVKALRR